jgi:hypothetical protein
MGKWYFFVTVLYISTESEILWDFWRYIRPLWRLCILCESIILVATVDHLVSFIPRRLLHLSYDVRKTRLKKVVVIVVVVVGYALENSRTYLCPIVTYSSCRNMWTNRYFLGRKSFDRSQQAPDGTHACESSVGAVATEVPGVLRRPCHCIALCSVCQRGWVYSEIPTSIRSKKTVSRITPI